MKKYTVLSAEHIDTWHYHGSWFEYLWKLKLEDEEGNIKERKIDTHTSFYYKGGADYLVGKTIEVDEKFDLFEVVE
jgi:hypothetical protein